MGLVFAGATVSAERAPPNGPPSLDQVTTPVISLTAGALTASSNGALIGLATTSSANITVNKANTVTSIASATPDPSVVGQAYTVTYAVDVVAPRAGTPTGTVTVGNGTSTCNGTLPTTNCTLFGDAVGIVSLFATYNGDENFNTSSSTAASHQVVPWPTTTALVSDTPDPSVVGVRVPVKAVVTIDGTGTMPASGLVTVSDGVDNCTFIPFVTTCYWTPTTVGARTLVATYDGNENFANSASAGMSHTVVAASEGRPLTVTRAGSGVGSISSNDTAIACGAACAYSYAQGTTLTLTAVPAAGSVFAGWLGACTGKSPCTLTINDATSVSATFAPDVPFLNLDVDGNNVADVLSDGLIMIRYLLSLDGAALVNGAIGTGTPSRVTPDAVLQYLNNLRPLLDIDGNGLVDAQTDGLMLLRYLFGLRGDTLIAGALGIGARRTTASEIGTYIGAQLP